MTSKMARKLIYYAKENNSKRFCLLSRLLTKCGTMDYFQNDMGKRSKLLGMNIELHTYMKSRVLFKSD